MSFNPLDLPVVNRALEGTEFHGALHHFPSLPSTQTLALEAARAGARAGVWIADEQTAGRGRGNHTWHSPAGAGLLLSALVTPAIPAPAALHLSLAVALACQAGLAETTPFQPLTHIDIRWPNDLLLRGSHSATFRKLGGILIESATAPASPTLRYAVLGIGLNVNQLTFPPDLDPLATSLRRELADPASPGPPPPLPRERLLASLLRHLHAALSRLATPTPLPPDLSRVSSWITGKPVLVAADPLVPGSQPFHGTTDGLTPEGFLRVRTPTGDLRIVRSGGVREA